VRGGENREGRARSCIHESILKAGSSPRDYFRGWSPMWGTVQMEEWAKANEIINVVQSSRRFVPDVPTGEKTRVSQIERRGHVKVVRKASGSEIQETGSPQTKSVETRPLNNGRRRSLSGCGALRTSHGMWN